MDSKAGYIRYTEDETRNNQSFAIAGNSQSVRRGGHQRYHIGEP